jgi:hypothetical protein
VLSALQTWTVPTGKSHVLANAPGVVVSTPWLVSGTQVLSLTVS